MPFDSMTCPATERPPLTRLWPLLLLPLLTGCAAAVVGGALVAAKTLHDRRSSSTVLEDQSIEIKVTDRLHQDDGPGRGNRIKTFSFNHVVLLIGEVREEDDRELAGRLAESFPQVRRVVNELAVTEPVGLGRRSRDNLLTARVKAALLGVDVDGFDPEHVNVSTARANVYLMGLVTGEEAEAVVEVARRQSGVASVVKVFEYLDEPGID